MLLRWYPQTLGKCERKNGVRNDFLVRRAGAFSWPEEVSSLIDHFAEEHNYSRWHFAYDMHMLGSVRKLLFLPYLRFVCHRG